MKVFELLKGVTDLAAFPSELLEEEVSRVTSDSREVGPGAAFVAVRGSSSDGHEFIGAAYDAGAVLVVGEAPRAFSNNKPYVQSSNSRWALARMAANFYGNPSHSMKVVGVTGTSGKTTTTFIIESILKESGYRVGLIGTVSFRFGEQVFPSTHTTPGAVELQQLLRQMKDAGCDSVVMEVSSHALKQRRSSCIAFDAVVFNNLSPEHLDFHPDMEDYYASKKLLFTEAVADSSEGGKATIALVHRDDAWGGRLFAELKKEPGRLRAVRSFGLSAVNDLSGDQLTIDLAGIHGMAGLVRVSTPLTGRFNAQNVLAAASACLALGVSPDQVERGLRALPSVPGRLEDVPNPYGIRVLVDYAHKPDALEKVLRTLSEVKGPGRLITVFGCGGDRDRSKRPVMGRIATENSDLCWVTSDNPRTESPDAIIREIVSGMGGAKNFRVEPDRARAIENALAEARSGDILLIAGKGHEDYQIIGKDKRPFDDRKVAAAALSRRKS